jgi:transcriptional regulator with XRE-family HTH domain
MTLKDVEAQSGFSATHISEIERGRTCPTINALSRIAQALDREPAYFIEREELPDLSHTRSSERSPAVVFGHVQVEALTKGVAGARLRAFQFLLPEGSQGRVEFDGHHGEESGYIVRGRIEVRVGDEKRVLETGDGFHYFARRLHGFRNIGAGPASLILVTNHRTMGG